MTGATAAFGFSAFIKDESQFFYVSVFLRLLQGIGDSMIMTVCKFIFPLIFKVFLLFLLLTPRIVISTLAMRKASLELAI